MNTKKRFKSSSTLLVILLTLFLLSACVPTPAPTPFIPPKAATPTSSPTATPPCTDSLAFVNDITIPDGTVVSPGERVDKGWLVQNNGSCNWDSRYRLRFVGGLEMGAVAEQALYPARAGTQAAIQIIFTAPSEPGTYTTAWQAINPDNEAFGDAVFMEIVVQVEAQVTLEIIDGE
jgi:hypothetical protein